MPSKDHSLGKAYPLNPDCGLTGLRIALSERITQADALAKILNDDDSVDGFGWGNDIRTSLTWLLQRTISEIEELYEALSEALCPVLAEYRELREAQSEQHH